MVGGFLQEASQCVAGGVGGQGYGGIETVGDCQFVSDSVVSDDSIGSRWRLCRRGKEEGGRKGGREGGRRKVKSWRRERNADEEMAHRERGIL